MRVRSDLINIASAPSLIALLERNRFITELKLGGNAIDEQTRSSISALVQENVEYVAIPPPPVIRGGMLGMFFLADGPEVNRYTVKIDVGLNPNTKTHTIITGEDTAVDYQHCSSLWMNKYQLQQLRRVKELHDAGQKPETQVDVRAVIEFMLDSCGISDGEVLNDLVLSYVTELDLTGIALSQSAWQRFCTALTKNQSIVALSLNCVEVNKQVLQALNKAISENTSLINLTIDLTLIISDEAKEDVVPYLLRGLKRNAVLKEFKIIGASLSDEELKIIDDELILNAQVGKSNLLPGQVPHISNWDDDCNLSVIKSKRTKQEKITIRKYAELKLIPENPNQLTMLANWAFSAEQEGHHGASCLTLVTPLLPKLTTLKITRLSSNENFDDFCSVLENTPTISNIQLIGDFSHFNNAQFVQVLTHLKKKNNLESIHFNLSAPFDSRSFAVCEDNIPIIKAIADANSNLKNLEISRLNLTKKGDVDFVNFLIGNTTLTRLKLPGVLISSQLIKQLINQNSYITELDIRGAYTSNDLEIIVVAMETNTTLKTLNLDTINYQLPAAQAIKKLLISNSTLTSLGLTPPNTTYDTCSPALSEQTIIEGLKQNFTLNTIFTIRNDSPCQLRFDLGPQTLLLRNLAIQQIDNQNYKGVVKSFLTLLFLCSPETPTEIGVMIGRALLHLPKAGDVPKVEGVVEDESSAEPDSEQFDPMDVDQESPLQNASAQERQSESGWETIQNLALDDGYEIPFNESKKTFWY